MSSFLLLLALVCIKVDLSLADGTFINVSFTGYHKNTVKFETTISHSDNLKDFLPDTEFDKIKFENQNIRNIMTNAFADLPYFYELSIQSCGVNYLYLGSFKNLHVIKLNITGNLNIF